MRPTHNPARPYDAKKASMNRRNVSGDFLKRFRFALVLIFCGSLWSLTALGQTTVTVGGGASVTCPATPTATWTTPPTGVTFSNWSRGSGVSCASAANALSGSGFNTASTAASFSANKYYSVTITADATHTFDLSQVKWDTAVSSGGATFAVQYSNNGGAVTSFGSSATNTTSNTFNGSVSVAAGTSLVLYLIPSGTGAAGTTVRWVNGSTITVTASAAATPTITTSVASLPSFGAITVGSNSSEQSYTVSGSNLTADITVVAPTDFQVSKTGGGLGFGSSVTLLQAGGLVNAQSVFVRFSPGSTGAKAGNITHDSTGATQKLVAVSGTGTLALASEPTIQASNLVFSAVTANSMTLTWTNGNGASRIVLAKSGSAVSSDPADGNSYTANSTFGSGSQIGTGNFVVFASSGNSVTVSNLAPGTTYHFAVYEFNGSAGSENYLTTSPLIGNQATLFAKYRSAASGNWGSAATWEVSNDGGTNWVGATATPTSADGTITILNIHTVTVAAPVSVDEVTVDSGGQITIASSNTLTVANGSGLDLNINGTVLNSGTLTISASATWAVNAAATFIQNTGTGISGQLGSATLNAASTFIYRGSSSLNITPAMSARTYGNLSFESTSGSYAPSSSGGSALTVNGNFSVGTNGAGTVSLNNSAFTADFIISGGLTIGAASSFTQGGNLSAGSITVATGSTYQSLITGDLTLAGGVSNAGTITLNGNGASCPGTDDILIRSSVNGTQRAWSGAGTFNLTDVDVKDQAGTAIITATSSTNSGNNGANWIITSTCVAGATYTWTPAVGGDWTLAANWSPARTLPSSTDVLVINSGFTPIITNVPSLIGTQTIAALRILNGTAATLKAPTGGGQLTIAGGSVSDLQIDSGSTLKFAGTDPLTITVSGGSTGNVAGQVTMQEGAHQLLATGGSTITFTGANAFSTDTDYSAATHPFGTGTGGNGSNNSIIFASGTVYAHSNGLSPFGDAGNTVVVFQTGSEADFSTTTGFEASGRTYANLKIGKGDPGGVALNPVVGGANNFQFDNLIIQNTNTANSSLTFNGTGTNTITIRGNITSVAAGAGGTAPDVIFTAGSGGIVIDKQGGGSITFGNILNTRGMELESSATVASGTTLTLARQLLLGISQPNSLVMTVDGDIAGSASGYVIGTVKKSLVTDGFIFPVGTINGYSPVQLTNVTGTGDFSARAVQALIPGLGLPGLARYWTLSGAITSTNLKFTYLDADIGGNEANYRIVKDTNGAGDPFSFPDGGADDVDEANNTATTLTPVSSFSNWSIVEPNAPTAVKLASFRATENNGEVMLQWQTGYETRNLGYNIYREQDGKRVAITPSLVAGSALVAGRQTRLGAGLSYTWYDKPNQNSEFRIQNSGAQSSEPGTQHSGTSYWLEDVDLNGTRTLHGPIVPEVSFAKPMGSQMRAELIGEVSRRTSPSGVQFNAWVTAATAAAASSDQRAGQTEAQPAGSKTQFQQVGSSVNSMRLDPSDMQHDIAGMAGVKIAVSRAGWYRVTQAELAAAGFSVPDAKQLQLYRNGREVAISVSTNDSFTTSDYFEFYGEGLDSPTDNAQTYYLVNGKGRSSRINLSNAPGKAAASGPQSFAYTVERKERMIYFSSLLNGDNENFFGQIVSSEPISATMPVSNLETGPAQLEVVLQGVTSESHLVQARLNGADLGTINFANTDHASQTFAIPATALREGDNTVELTSLGGASDVSLVDVMRLTYNRGFVAQDNALAFSVASQQGVRISGFTNPAVRVFDVSDSLFVSELKPLVTTEGGGYTAYVEVRQASALSPHTLLAIAGGQAQPADSVRANNPSSSWTQTAGADYVIVTTAELKSALEALAQLRRGQGMTVAVVDVEDIYDEFSFGKHSPEAIRSFLLRANKNWKRQPHFVLLAGDASYDPKNYLGQGMNDLVPTRLVDTALNETASDDWLTDFNGDGIGDLAVGRLPVHTAAEAGALVNKIIGYESASPDPSRGALLVADTHFEAPSKTVQNLMPAGLPVQTVNRGDTDDATAHNLVVAGINQGPRVANYFGHGSNGIWSGAGLLSSDDTAALTNTNRLSVFTMMTCFNGYFQDPYNDSLSEALLKARGGAVAVWASTTLTEPAGQNVIGAEFYRLLFGVQPITLGDAARAAKSVTNDRDVRRTWTLFGDPAMRLR